MQACGRGGYGRAIFGIGVNCLVPEFVSLVGRALHVRGQWDGANAFGEIRRAPILSRSNFTRYSPEGRDSKTVASYSSCRKNFPLRAVFPPGLSRHRQVFSRVPSGRRSRHSTDPPVWRFPGKARLSTETSFRKIRRHGGKR